MTEIWKPVVGYEGAYEVSDLGRVRSLGRRVEQRSRKGSVYGRLLPGTVLIARTNEKRGGYRYVELCADGVPTTCRVARLVAEAFIGPRPIGREIAHVNGVCTDDRPGNLAYKTHAENVADTQLHGTTLRGEAVGNSKLTSADVRAIRRRKGSTSQRALAAEFGICRTHVSNIHNGKRWKHVAGN